MRAMDVMVRDVVTASPDEDVDQVIELLAKHDASTLPWWTTRDTWSA